MIRVHFVIAVFLVDTSAARASLRCIAGIYFYLSTQQIRDWSWLVGNFRITVKQLLYESAERHHWYIQAMETDRDLIHILLQYPPTASNVSSVFWNRKVPIMSGKRMLLSWETIIGLNIHCGQMVIFRQVSEMPHRRPFRNISPIRVNKNIGPFTFFVGWAPPDLRSEPWIQLLLWCPISLLGYCILGRTVGASPRGPRSRSCLCQSIPQLEMLVLIRRYPLWTISFWCITQEKWKTQNIP